MFLPGLTLSNEAFVKHCQNNMFWSVDSFEALDQQTMAIDLIDRIRYGTTLILRDGTWDPEHVSRIRLYRIWPGSKELPEGRMTSEDFVSWCMMKEKELGFPVLVVWAVEQDSPFDPEDCW